MTITDWLPWASLIIILILLFDFDIEIKWCCHKWPLYTDNDYLRSEETPFGIKYSAWFVCYKCEARRLKSCDIHGMRK